jgi:hypothetical protein
MVNDQWVMIDAEGRFPSAITHEPSIIGHHPSMT